MAWTTWSTIASLAAASRMPQTSARDAKPSSVVKSSLMVYSTTRPAFVMAVPRSRKHGTRSGSMLRATCCMPTTAAGLVEESSSRTRRLLGKSGRRGTPDWMPTVHRLVSWDIVKNPTFSEVGVSSVSGKRLSTIA